MEDPKLKILRDAKSEMCDYIRQEIYASLGKGGNNKVIDILIEKFILYYDKPVHSISEINQRENRKVKGDLFEILALAYLVTSQNYRGKNWYTRGWLLKDVPNEIAEKLGIKGRDMGIDIILEVKNESKSKYCAVQVKYRKPNRYKSKNVLGWKQLSTFYSLVQRTGPYQKHIIFTNADYARHVGKKNNKDKTIAIGTLKNVKNAHWYRIAEYLSNKRTDTFPSEIETDKKMKKSIEELRALRISHFA